MAEDQDKDAGTQEDQDQDSGTQEDQDQDSGTQEDQEKDSGKRDQDTELKKAIGRRDRALKEKAALADQLRALKEKYEPEKADPVKVANRRLVAAEARVVLTGKGITDPGDQKEVMDFLALDSVTVSDDGEVDSDTLTDRVERLSSIFGKLGGGGGNGRRTPRVDTRDRGGEKAKPEDAASRRRREMLRG
jgi:hypothetical protein